MTGARQVTIATPPGPYSEHAVAAVVADRDARIRELEAEVLRLREVEAAAKDVLDWNQDRAAWRRLMKAVER